MTNTTEQLVALDVGEKRIGVAYADTIVRLASPLLTIEVDGREIEKIGEIVKERAPEKIVIGYPRNQAGEPTEQTKVAEAFAGRLEQFNVGIVFQDESLTSVLAEERLKRWGKPYTKADIDSHAAGIILQDYMDAHYGY